MLAHRTHVATGLVGSNAAGSSARVLTGLDGVEKDAFRVLIGRDARLMDGLYRFKPRRGGLHRQPDARPAQGLTGGAAHDEASGAGA
jgi:hypothetical protein